MLFWLRHLAVKRNDTGNYAPNKHRNMTMQTTQTEKTDFKAYADKVKADDKAKADAASDKRNEKLRSKSNKAQALLDRVKSGDAPQKTPTKSSSSSASNDRPIYLNLAEYARLIDDGLYGSVIHQWQQALDIIVNNLNDDYSFTKNQINKIIIPLMVADKADPLPNGALNVWCEEGGRGYKQDLVDIWEKYSAWSFGKSSCVSSQVEKENAKKLKEFPNYKPKAIVGIYALFSFDPKVNDNYKG